MSKYRYKTSPEFEVDFKRLCKNFELIERLKKKIKIISENPYHYKPLRNVLKGKRRTHIGSFVLIFEIIEDENLIVLHRLQHHDKAYK